MDLTNLHRQQYKASQIGQPKALALADNLREANPYLALEPHVVRVTEDNLAPLLAEATLVCEAFDQAEAKAMLVNAVLERFPEKFLVAASGMAGLGSANAITTRRVSRRFYLCGDGVSDVADGLGLVASRVAVCAGHQAHMVLRLLSGRIRTLNLRKKGFLCSSIPTIRWSSAGTPLPPGSSWGLGNTP